MSFHIVHTMFHAVSPFVLHVDVGRNRIVFLGCELATSHSFLWFTSAPWSRFCWPRNRLRQTHLQEQKKKELKKMTREAWRLRSRSRSRSRSHNLSSVDLPFAKPQTLDDVGSNNSDRRYSQVEIPSDSLGLVFSSLFSAVDPPPLSGHTAPDGCWFRT